jgi:LuxR family maltose regulon positive regulatory protein
MERGDPLLRSKLIPPGPRPACVARAGPRRLLDEGSAGRLTLVDSPPGWGKTTLVAEWVRSREGQHAWLSLDPEDDDPRRFWGYLIEAVRATRPDFGERARALLFAPGTPAMAGALPALLDELDAAADGILIVLDDYHVITDPQIHAAMVFLIEHLAARDHLVVLSRADPPFPLPRWRVRGDVTEVRIDDLRFDAADTACLLNDVLGLGLPPGPVARLQERTEGWAAGLLLAAISLRSRPDPAGFVEGFAGDDRHIVDYLGTEVLDSLDDTARRFLTRTSILDKLSGPLCDAVTQSAGSALMLVRMERSNLFVSGLDTRGEWYRYHQLFAELLRVELERTAADEIPTLHRRAAGWFLENGHLPESLRHLVNAGDRLGAAELLAERWSELLQRGDLAAITQSLDLLGDETVRADPRLCLVMAWMTINLGRVTELTDWIDAAERALKDWDGESSTVFAAAAGMLRCIEEYLTGDTSGAIAAARQAVELDSAELPPWRSVGCPVLGIALYWCDRAEESRATLVPAMATARDAGNFLAQLHGTGCLALAAAVRGERTAAAELIGRANAVRNERGFRDHWAGAMTLLAQARLDTDANRLDVAERELTEAVDLSRRGLARIELAYGLSALASLQLERRDLEAAAKSMGEAQAALAHCPDPGSVAGFASEVGRRVGPLDPAPVRRLPYGEQLSQREVAVLALLPTDLSLRDIASSLHVSAHTIKTQTRSIYRKLGVANRAEAVGRARELGLA